MNKLVETLGLDAPSGGTSMMRVAVFLVVIVLLSKNLYLTIHTGVNVPLDATDLLGILGSLGIKAAQRPFESKNTTNATVTTTP